MRKSRDPESSNDLPFPVSTGNWQIAFCLLFSIFFFLTFFPEKAGTGYLRQGIRLGGIGESGMNYSSGRLQFSKQVQIIPIKTLVRQPPVRFPTNECWGIQLANQGHLPPFLSPLPQPITSSRHTVFTQCQHAPKFSPKCGLLYSSLSKQLIFHDCFSSSFHVNKNSQILSSN